MAKVNVEADCGNAPKKLFVRDLMVGIADNDIAFILDCLTDDIHWQLVGRHSTTRKTEVEDLLNDWLPEHIDEMTIVSIISHGDECSTDGIMISRDGKTFAFCHVCKFNGHGKKAKIKAIRTYVIDERG